MKTTNKESINRLVEICYQKGIKNVIFSPGSRNAPLIIAFHAAKKFDIKTIPDERCAAFFAMGQGLATGKPTIICCTSGSAVLNYAPAIVEAYYQHIPLLVLTADRPSQWIDQGIGQSMRQKKVYQNYIKESYSWIEESASPEDLQINDNIISSAIDFALKLPLGPVHINIPFHEPLYDQIDYERPLIELSTTKKVHTISESNLQEQLKKDWLQAKKKIVIAGLMPPDSHTGQLLAELSERKDIVLLTEKTSNIKCENDIACLDRVLHSMSEEPSSYSADILISIGGPIVSKKIKQFFLHNKPSKHWFIDEGTLQDTYLANPKHLSHSTAAIKMLAANPNANSLSFQESWELFQRSTNKKHKEFLDSCPYSDLKVFELLFDLMPNGIDLHLANSTPIRYAQLFEGRKDLRYYSNRGVSGIDGSTSTALGFASQANDQDSVLITGDLSFFYDSNAFWLQETPHNLTIILINNKGGGIFRYIPGPATTGQLESVFEAPHNLKAKNICEMYGISYTSVERAEKVTDALNKVFRNRDRLQLLEIFTPRIDNAEILKSYFKSMIINE